MEIRNLSVGWYAQGFTMWLYRAATEAIDAALRPGFFDDAASMMQAGDVVTITARDGASMQRVADTRKSVILEAVR
jgi:hypothetical protein